MKTAHMELAQPDIAAAIADCATEGASKVIIAPYFLSRHESTQNLPGSFIMQEEHSCDELRNFLLPAACLNKKQITCAGGGTLPRTSQRWWKPQQPGIQGCSALWPIPWVRSSHHASACSPADGLEYYDWNATRLTSVFAFLSRILSDLCRN